MHNVYLVLLLNDGEHNSPQELLEHEGILPHSKRMVSPGSKKENEEPPASNTEKLLQDEDVVLTSVDKPSTAGKEKNIRFGEDAIAEFSIDASVSTRIIL